MSLTNIPIAKHREQSNKWLTILHYMIMHTYRHIMTLVYTGEQVKHCWQQNGKFACRSRNPIAYSEPLLVLWLQWKRNKLI